MSNPLAGDPTNAVRIAPTAGDEAHFVAAEQCRRVWGRARRGAGMSRRADLDPRFWDA